MTILSKLLKYSANDWHDLNFCAKFFLIFSLNIFTSFLTWYIQQKLLPQWPHFTRKVRKNIPKSYCLTRLQINVPFPHGAIRVSLLVPGKTLSRELPHEEKAFYDDTINKLEKMQNLVKIS